MRRSQPLHSPEANTYRGLHAAYYNLIYAGKPYADEARFVADAIARTGEKGPWNLLDLACGTGLHAFEFASMGHTVTGVDYSEDLLAIARKSNAARRFGVRFLNQDIRNLDVDGGPFEVITWLFDSIGYLLTDDGVVAGLSQARTNLSVGGMLAVEFLHAAAILEHASPVRVRRWPTQVGGTLVRISEVELDRAGQTMHVAYELFDIEPDGTVTAHWTEVQENRFFSVEEMRSLLERAGLVAKFLPAYRCAEAIDDRVWHVLALARRAEGKAP